jgi:hypothetical protein
MQIRRRCRRCYLSRAVFYLLTLFAMCSSAMLSYNFYANVFSERRNEGYQTFLLDKRDLDDARIEPVGSLQLLHEDYFNTTNLVCRNPKLMIDSAKIWKHLNPVKQSQPDCEKSTNWVYVENGLSKQSFKELFV